MTIIVTTIGLHRVTFIDTLHVGVTRNSHADLIIVCAIITHETRPSLFIVTKSRAMLECALHDCYSGIIF